MKITALITARGENTLRDKHLRYIKNKEVIRYPIDIVNKLDFIDAKFLSSDDDKILEIGESNGFQKIKRPDELCTPDSLHIDTIKHSIDFIQSNFRIKTDILIVLMGNSATVKEEWIKKSIDLIINNDSISSVVPVFQNNDHHPYRAKRINENGFLNSYFNFGGKEISTNRQELAPNYFICHNFWTIKLNKLKLDKNGEAPWKFLGKNVFPIIVDKCFDIHDLDDLKEAEKWLNQVD
jgi:CMP-N,N'-diacetyllegionaminic acid synthase